MTEELRRAGADAMSADPNQVAPPTDEELLEVYYKACRAFARLSFMPASPGSLHQGSLAGIRSVRAAVLRVPVMPAPASPVSPESLAEEVLRVVLEAQACVGPGSIGAEQYQVAGQPQKFETMELDDLAEYLNEEALDQVNYGVMMSLRARRLQSVARRADDLSRQRHRKELFAELFELSKREYPSQPLLHDWLVRIARADDAP